MFEEVYFVTVDSRYLEVQGTLFLNTSRYMYPDISDLPNGGNNRTDIVEKWRKFHNILLPVDRFLC